MDNPPRVACIGAGRWGRNLVRNFHALGALAAVCDSDPDRRALATSQFPGVAVFSRVEDLLADRGIDAVAIATPARTHAALARAALEAGKDVFVEKPLALSVVEGQELVDLARARGRILMVGHLLWYHPAVLRLRELVQGGELGRILYVYSNRLNLGQVRREENILWSFAPHDISVILGLVGEFPDEVRAHGGSYLHRRVADVTVTWLSFPSGVRGHVFVSWLHPFKEQKLVVVGDRKMAVFDDTSPTEKLMLYPHIIAWKNNVPVPRRAEGEPVAVDEVEPLRAECAHFLECVVRRQRPRTDGEEALKVLSVLEAAERAMDAEMLGGARLRSAVPAGVFVHESSYVDDGVSIGEGTQVWHFSHILRNSTIGRNCRIGQNVVIGPNVRVGNNVKIQNNVSVYEGVTLEDDVFCGPSMVFTNVKNPRSEIPRRDEILPTTVRRGATLGANCTVVCGVTIGEYAFVAAGAVVTRDVPAYGLVAGNPARLAGWVCRCGHRIRFDDGATIGRCGACRLEYRRSDAREVIPVGRTGTAAGER